MIVATLALGALAADGARVEMHQGLVSAHFEAVPVPQALDAVRAATGVEIVVPGSVKDKSLTLTVERAPFEQFVRRILDGLELGGFAVVYEATGAAQRVIVVDRAQPGPPDTGSATPSGQPSPTAPGTSEPVYIPPTTPPIYVPPATPPVYIPPARPPVYVPPATPPVYVPPATPPATTPSQ